MGGTIEPEIERCTHVADLGDTPVSCLLCGAPEPRRLFFRTGKWFWMCVRCELIFVHDIYPEFLADLDGPGGMCHGLERREASARERRVFDALLRTFEPHRQKNRLLEVGCGQGLFLEHARRAGWQESAVDVLPPMTRLARERGLDVFTGELADAGFEDGTFDVAYMSEVIEHIVDPAVLMQEVHRVLRPGGIALLGTDNARSWASRLRGSRWHYYRFGGLMHIRFYGPKSARALAVAAGFAGVHVRTRGFAFREAFELQGRWYRPLVKLAQNLVSPFAGPCGAGHRLRLTFRKEG